MLDDLRKVLLDKPQEISKEQYNEWMRSPVTIQLKQDLAISVLERKTEARSLDFHANITESLAAQGYNIALEKVIDWEPESVAAIQEGDAND